MSKNIRHHIIVANKFPITKTFRKIPENLGCQFLTLIWFLNICYHNIVNIDHKYLGRDTKDEYLANSNNSLAKKGQPPLGGASWEHLELPFLILCLYFPLSMCCPGWENLDYDFSFSNVWVESL